MNDEEEEEEKEVDPSLVGSLDNVYTEAPGTMPGEDPFKRVAMMLDNEKPSNLMEMEKTLEAMEASIDQESSQELDSSDDMTSLDCAGMRRPARGVVPCDSLDIVSLSERVGLQTEHRPLNQQQWLSSGVEEEEAGAVGGASMMPDLLSSGPPPSTPPDIQLSSQPVPDVTTHSRSPHLTPDLAGAGSPGTARPAGDRPLDLLHNMSPSSMSRDAPLLRTDSQQPVDLTDGLLRLRVGPGDGET